MRGATSRTLAWQGEQRDALWEELKTFLPTAGGDEKAAEPAAEPVAQAEPATQAAAESAAIESTTLNPGSAA